jgi:hypothetical protein
VVSHEARISRLGISVCPVVGFMKNAQNNSVSRNPAVQQPAEAAK